MRYIFLCLLCACAVSTAWGQQSNSQDEHRFVVMPREQGLLLIAPQPDSPLKFENARLLVNIKSGLWVKSFELRNRGEKPIRGFTVAAAGNGEWGWEASDASYYILPGETAPPMVGNSRDEILPLTKELREKLKLQGPMKGIVALIVVRVEYADGSTFEDSAYGAMKDYFEKLYVGSAKGATAQAVKVTRF